MRLQPRTSPETDRCHELIQQLGSVLVHDLHVEADFHSVTLTGRTGSWYAKQVATAAARRMYPNHRIDNQLQVVTPR
ncbi:MAG: hypothetical protein ACKO2P_18015 [Planctomycetota bacterium]